MDGKTARQLLLFGHFSVNLLVLQPERRKIKQEDENTFWDIQLEMVNLAWVCGATELLLMSRQLSREKWESNASFYHDHLSKPHKPPPANTGRKTVCHSFLLVFLLYDYSFHLHKIFRHQPGETKTIRVNPLAFLLLCWVAL
jgi:hypothetical protein